MSNFYELWRQKKQLKTMEMSEASHDIYVRDLSINSNLKPLTNFTSSIRSSEFKDILPWNISPMITKTVSISPRINKLQ